MALNSSLSAERVAIVHELARLRNEHERLRRTPGRPFDWDAHHRHLEALKAVSRRLKDFREQLGL